MVTTAERRLIVLKEKMVLVGVELPKGTWLSAEPEGDGTLWKIETLAPDNSDFYVTGYVNPSDHEFASVDDWFNLAEWEDWNTHLSFWVLRFEVGKWVHASYWDFTDEALDAFLFNGWVTMHRISDEDFLCPMSDLFAAAQLGLLLEKEVAAVVMFQSEGDGEVAVQWAFKTSQPTTGVALTPSSPSIGSAYVLFNEDDTQAIVALDADAYGLEWPALEMWGGTKVVFTSGYFKVPDENGGMVVQKGVNQRIENLPEVFSPVWGTLLGRIMATSRPILERLLGVDDDEAS